MKKHHENPKLGTLLATSICGNDILSSALYVSGIAALFAGIYAPLVLLAVAGLLYIYRFVYQEVVEALPINGGAYNCLLNATSKTFASVAGVMTILSYVATAVISAKIGVEYIHTVLHWVPVFPVTVLLLFAFALLVIAGVKDSAKVALAIFVVHVWTLAIFVLMGLFLLLTGKLNFGPNILATQELITQSGGLHKMLFLAFSASLLGISGFESSANFVEEQQPGVFRKTLKNMWLGVTFFNPLIALIVVGSLSLPSIAQSKDFLLADAGLVLGGKIFQYIIAFDAFLVLSGAVLTAYVGVTGLINRMTLDDCLPGFLIKENSRGSHPRIVIAFFLLCTTILIITKGQLLSLAGVYTISFLGVMSLFALGNLVLRETRTDLKRTYQAPLHFVIIAFFATAAGIIGNILIDPANLYYFSLYFIPAITLVFMMIYKDFLLRIALRLTRSIPSIHEYIKRIGAPILEGRFVVFIHHPKRLYESLQYINHNETGTNITIVHCRDDDCPDEDDDHSYSEIKKLLPNLQKAGVFPHLKLQLLYKNKPFGPALIDELAKELHIPKNRILIGSVHHHHDFDYHELGGVRIISG